MELKKKEKRIGDSIYFAFLGATIFRHFLETTVIDYAWISNIVLAITFVLGICVVIKILTEWKKDWTSVDIIVAVVTVGFLACSNFYIHHDYIWEYLLLILGARNINAKKIIKIYLLVTVPLFLLTVIASLLGFIDNLMFYRNDISDPVRYAMGFMYVTNFCAHLFFFCAAYAYLRGKAIKYIEIAGIAGIGVVCYFLSRGRNSTICIALLVVVLLVNKVLERKKTKTNNQILEMLLPLFMPVLAILSIILALIYSPNSSIMVFLNNCLGHRLSMDQEAFQRFNVTWLGQNFNQRIFGGESSVGFPDNYFFIDCSYVSVLLSMGILALVAIIVIWYLITLRECKNKSYVTAIIMCVVAIHCFIEQNMLNISYNPFFILVFAGDAMKFLLEERTDSVNKIKINDKVLKNCLSLIIFSLVVEILAFNMQSLTSAFRSYISQNDYTSVVGAGGISEDGLYLTNDSTYIRLENVTDEVDSLYLTLNLYEKDTTVLKERANYTYVVYGYNSDTQEYETIESVSVQVNNPASGYVKFAQKLNYEKYLIGFSFDEEYQFEIKKLEINGSKPFHVSYLRLVIIYALLVLVYYYGIEKRNAEVKPETIEVAKASNQFESTGALRTEAHKNMKAVYDAKNPFYIFLKRAFDIVMSGIAIIALSPIFLATAIAIKIEDNGPVFFVQNRAGKDMKPFKMWKFRSMYVNADEKLKEMMKGNEQTGHAFKIKNDPRITKVGKFIRKFSIDELPQLFNIFLGDMSIVGPRPILCFQMEECDDYDKQRLIVQPGLTCIWQVSGRANIKWDQWIEMDLDYIDKMSPWMDIKLICLTIPCVLSGDGAY